MHKEKITQRLRPIDKNIFASWPDLSDFSTTCGLGQFSILGERIAEVDKFMFLGLYVTYRGDSDTDISIKI